MDFEALNLGKNLNKERRCKGKQMKHFHARCCQACSKILIVNLVCKLKKNSAESFTQNLHCIESCHTSNIESNHRPECSGLLFLAYTICLLNQVFSLTIMPLENLYQIPLLLFVPRTNRSYLCAINITNEKYDTNLAFVSFPCIDRMFATYRLKIDF